MGLVWEALGLGSLDPSDALSALEDLGIEINDGNTSPAALATMVNNLLNGQRVDLISWSTSGDIPLLDFNETIPVYSLGVPGIVSAEIDATFGASANLSYKAGFGVDTNGFWIQQGTGVSLNFDLYAGVQGQVEIFGIPLAKAGGNIGFDISPYVSLAPDPYSNVPGRDYVSDMMLFGSSLPQDFIDSLSEGIEGSLTGTIYASIDLFFLHFGASFSVDIPVFNIEHDPAWPGGGGSGGAPSWPVTYDSTTGLLTFNGSSGSNGATAYDNLQLSQAPGTHTLTINWKGHGTKQFPAVNEFEYQGGSSAKAQVTTTQGFDIPIYDVANGAAPVYFQGGNNNNTLIGGSGSDTLVGGNGDNLIAATTGNDLIVGGQGVNTLIGGSGNDSIYGGPGDDVIYGGSGVYYIAAGDGTDTIYGGAGHAPETTKGVLTYPVIEGGDGHDLIINSSSATAQTNNYPGLPVRGFTVPSTLPLAMTSYPAVDTSAVQIYGNGGTDTVYGGPGETFNNIAMGDTIVAGSGPSVIYGGGNDSIRGGFGQDNLYGGPGSNTIEGGLGNDTIYGGNGFDVTGAGKGDGQSSGSNLLIGGAGSNLIYGDSTGNNVLIGGPGRNTLYAGSGTDYLDGGTGLSALYGGPGADTMVVAFNPAGGTDQDTIVGGTGNDTLVLQGPPNQDNHIDLTLVPGTTETYSASLYNPDTNPPSYEAQSPSHSHRACSSSRSTEGQATPLQVFPQTTMWRSTRPCNRASRSSAVMGTTRSSPVPATIRWLAVWVIIS